MTTGYSVNIGVGAISKAHYGTKGRLAGAENDARAMAALAKAKGFTDRLLLVGKDANTIRVRQALQDAAAALRSGDTLFLTYSGHGGQIPQLGKAELDSLDEGWCLVDRMLVDDELNRMLALFEAGVHIVAFVDSCHSGTSLFMVENDRPALERLWARTMVRLTFGKIKQLSSAEMRYAMQHHEDVYLDVARALSSTVKAPVLAHVVQISACEDWEVTADGSPYSAFTQDVLDETKGLKADRSITELHAALVQATKKRTPKLVDDLGTRDAAHDTTHPLLRL